MNLSDDGQFVDGVRCRVTPEVIKLLEECPLFMRYHGKDSHDIIGGSLLGITIISDPTVERWRYDIV